MSNQALILNQANVSKTNPNVLTLNFGQNYSIPPDHEVALLSAQIPYSWKNITSAFNNQSVSYYFPPNGQTYLVTFGNVFFQTSDINNYIQQAMVQNGSYLINSVGQNVYYFSLVTNYSVYGNDLIMTPLPASLPAGWSYPSNWTGTLSSANALTPQLIFSGNNFGALLGYAINTSYPATPQASTQIINSPLIPQLSPAVGFFISCNFVNAPQYNTYSDVIFSYTPDVTFGQIINIQPPQSIWYPCTSTQFSFLQITLRDSNYQPLGVLDPNMVISILIRKRPKN